MAGFWNKLFGAGASTVVEAVNDTAKTAADIVERWAPGDQKTHEMYMDVQKALNDSASKARSAAPSSTPTTGFAQALHAVADFVNHMMAPVLTVFVVGALFGWWQVTVATVNPIILTWAEGVGAYWLGARAITRDIPSLIKMIVELRKGNA